MIHRNTYRHSKAPTVAIGDVGTALAVGSLMANLLNRSQTTARLSRVILAASLGAATFSAGCESSGDEQVGVGAHDVSSTPASEAMSGLKVLEVRDGNTFALHFHGAYSVKQELLRIPLTGGPSQSLLSWSRPQGPGIPFAALASSHDRLSVLRPQDGDPSGWELASVDFLSGATTVIAGSKLLPDADIRSPLYEIKLQLIGCNTMHGCDDAALVVMHHTKSALVRDIVGSPRVEPLPGAERVYGFADGRRALLCDYQCATMVLDGAAPVAVGDQKLVPPANVNRNRSPLLGDGSYFGSREIVFRNREVERVWPFEPARPAKPLPATDKLVEIADEWALAVRGGERYVATNLATGAETVFPPASAGDKLTAYENVIAFGSTFYIGTERGLLQLDAASGTQAVVAGTEHIVYRMRRLAGATVGAVFAVTDYRDAGSETGLVLVRPNVQPVVTGPLVRHNGVVTEGDAWSARWHSIELLPSADGKHVYGAAYRDHSLCLMTLATFDGDALKGMTPLLEPVHVSPGSRAECRKDTDFKSLRAIAGSENVLVHLDRTKPGAFWAEPDEPAGERLRIVRP